MQTDNPGVKVRENRNAPNHGLTWDSQPQHDGEPKQLGTLFPQPQHQDKQANGDDGQDKSQQPVSKLNDSVKAHLWGGNKRVFGAPRPGRATQPRTGQPHRTAGADNEYLADQ